MHVPLDGLLSLAAFDPDSSGGITPGDNAWVLASAALVLFMTPGLALFYAGMVRRKHALGMLVQNWMVMALVGVVWVVLTYTLAFGPDWGGTGLIGDLHFLGLRHVDQQAVPGETLSISPIVFVAFQMTFAVITPALITGATADRLKLGAFCAVVVVWSVLVYAPIAHWVFSPGGWLYQRGAEDFAGGTVVHVDAAMSALAVLLVVRNRRGWPHQPMRPHNLPLTILGAGILWFGWLGFDAGSALAANDLSAHALVNTNTAAATAVLGWLAVERYRTGRATTLGAASGAVAGLVAITPSCGFVDLFGSLVIGLVAGAVCCLACRLKFRLGRDDALDVLGVHLVGGVVGALLIGVLGTNAFVPGAGLGLLHGGGLHLLAEQGIEVGAVAGYAFAGTFAIAWTVHRLVGLRVSAADEDVGLDRSRHGEVAYDLGIGAGTATTRTGAPTSDGFTPFPEARRWAGTGGGRDI